jgi:hypothetical protein
MSRLEMQNTESVAERGPEQLALGARRRAAGSAAVRTGSAQPPREDLDDAPPRQEHGDREAAVCGRRSTAKRQCEASSSVEADEMEDGA